MSFLNEEIEYNTDAIDNREKQSEGKKYENFEDDMMTVSKDTGLTPEEKEQMFIEHEKLIYFISNRYKKGMVSADEIDAAAFFGFAKGLDTYRKDKGRFNTYVGKCVDNEIKSFLSKEKKIRDNNTSMSNPIASESGNLELGDIIKEPVMEGMEVEGSLILTEDITLLMSAIEELHPREQFIIEHRYGLNNRKELKQSELAEILNRTQASISKTEKLINEKLKNILKDKISLESTEYYSGGYYENVALKTN